MNAKSEGAVHTTSSSAHQMASICLQKIVMRTSILFERLALSSILGPTSSSLWLRGGIVFEEGSSTSTTKILTDCTSAKCVPHASTPDFECACIHLP